MGISNCKMAEELFGDFMICGEDRKVFFVPAKVFGFGESRIKPDFEAGRFFSGLTSLTKLGINRHLCQSIKKSTERNSEMLNTNQSRFDLKILRLSS